MITKTYIYVFIKQNICIIDRYTFAYLFFFQNNFRSHLILFTYYIEYYNSREISIF